MCIGIPTRAYLEASVSDVIVRMLCIKASYVGNRLDTAEAIDFFRTGLVRGSVTVVSSVSYQGVFYLMAMGETCLPVCCGHRQLTKGCLGLKSFLKPMQFPLTATSTIQRKVKSCEKCSKHWNPTTFIICNHALSIVRRTRSVEEYHR